MSSREGTEGIFTFITGLLLGLLGGAALGVLFSTKSGDALRQDVHTFVRTLPARVNDELHNPKGKTRQFIEETRTKLENQVDRVKENQAAVRMAKAKEAEALANSVDL